MKNKMAINDVKPKLVQLDTLLESPNDYVGKRIKLSNYYIGGVTTHALRVSAICLLKNNMPSIFVETKPCINFRDIALVLNSLSKYKYVVKATNDYSDVKVGEKFLIPETDTHYNSKLRGETCVYKGLSGKLESGFKHDFFYPRFNELLSGYFEGKVRLKYSRPIATLVGLYSLEKNRLNGVLELESILLGDTSMRVILKTDRNK